MKRKEKNKIIMHESGLKRKNKFPKGTFIKETISVKKHRRTRTFSHIHTYIKSY